MNVRTATAVPRTAVDARPVPDPERLDIRLPWLVLLVTFAAVPTIYALAAPRVFAGGVPSPLFGAVSAGSARAVASLLILGELAMLAGLFTLALPVLRWPRPGRGTTLAAVGMGLATLASGIVHDSAAVGMGLLAGPAAFLAVGVVPKPSLAWFERVVVVILRTLLVGSVATGLVVPSWGAEGGYDGVLPISSRLAGLAAHPNTLGPLAVAALILEWKQRPRSRVFLAVALVVLVWTQSKTAWAAAAIVATVMATSWLRRNERGHPWLPHLLLGAIVLATVSYALDLAAPGQQTARTDTSAETFTGRTAIWEVTLEVWQADPVLGYGPDLWRDAMNRRYAGRVGFQPGQAHNQLLQSLGQAGIVGATALIAFLFGLSQLARRGHDRTSGATTALFALLLLRAFTESPLDGGTIGGNFFLALVTFTYVLLAANEDRADHAG